VQVSDGQTAASSNILADPLVLTGVDIYSETFHYDSCTNHLPHTENLAAGTGSGFDIAAAIKSWTDEVCEQPRLRPLFISNTEWSQLAS
jgi:hypothetical protein